jgi:tRNA(Ile)-lysidine synthase
MNKFGLLPIENIVQTQLNTYFEAFESPVFVMGVSGGPDSMCLLHILHKLGVDLFIVHVNYQKRGEASGKDAALVEDTAKHFGYQCKIQTVDSGEGAEGQNFQQWARNVRYEAFEREAAEIQADGIITAHHQDDQIETILQKIFRGAGLASWSGMRPWDGRLFRPFLGVSRTDILGYCRAQTVDYRVDSSNLESDFARNFLRNEWLANLKQHFPGWRKNVLRVSRQADVFASSLRYILNRILDEQGRLKRSEFLKLEKKLQKSLLVYYLHRIDASAEVSRSALKGIGKLKNLQTGKSIQLSSNIEFMRDREFFKILTNTGKADAIYTLREEDVKNSGILVNGLKFQIIPFKRPDFAQCLYLNSNEINWPLRLRKWKEGDRFQPFGMEGRQSVADHLTNRKVSAAEKSDALVLEASDKIICAVLFPANEKRLPPGTISEKMRCRESNEQCLTIKSKI